MQVTDNSVAKVRTGLQVTHILEAQYPETTNTSAAQPILNTDPSVLKFKKHFFFSAYSVEELLVSVFSLTSPQRNSKHPELRPSIRPCFPTRQRHEPEQRAHFQLRKDLMRTKSSLPALLACSPHSCPHEGKPWPVGKVGRSTASKLRGGGRGPSQVRRPRHEPQALLNDRTAGGRATARPHSC